MEKFLLNFVGGKVAVLDVSYDLSGSGKRPKRRYMLPKPIGPFL
jgi:hypothetical protein